jgi:phosphate:Na+ symporter
MSGTLILLQLAGNVALLLWGMHMVQTGIVRSLGGSLHHVLAVSLSNRGKAFLAGLGITAIMQSSTATALMASNFMAGGLMELVPGLAAILGANVGSTFIVQVLSFNIAIFAPLLILAGVVAFKRGRKTRVHDLGRVGIGLGLVLLALHAIVLVIEPVEQAAALRQLLGLLTGDPLMNILAGALLTWAAYSSVATVLLMMSLAATHVIASPDALSLALGANLGMIIPQYLTAGQNPVARRLALGNLLMRGAGCLIIMPLLTPVSHVLGSLESDPARQIADFHTLFNAALALLFIGALGPIARFCKWALPAPARNIDPAALQYLTDTEPRPAAVVIATAQREVLRIADLLHDMIVALAEALRNDDRKKLAQIAALDDTVDDLHRAIKLRLVEVMRETSLTEADARRCSEILLFAINLEHVGDVLDVSLRDLAARKIKNRLNFSTEDNAQIAEMNHMILAQLQLATSIFMTRDDRGARLLMEEKIVMRDRAEAATDEHLARLGAGEPESVETSGLYIDIVRDFKRITAHLASVAYPILEQNGALRRSRVRDLSANLE